MTPASTATPPITSRPQDDVEYSTYESRTPATTTNTGSAKRKPIGFATSERDAETPSLVPLGEALRDLVGLQSNWDSYGALPPSRSALVHTWELASRLVEVGMPIPQVFPTRSGGVQLEWHVPRASLEWELDADVPSGVFVFDDHATGERIDGELPKDLDLIAVPLSRILLG
jgi:hypothetical protein